MINWSKSQKMKYKILKIQNFMISKKIFQMINRIKLKKIKNIKINLIMLK